MNYILNTNHNVYHKDDCPCLPTILKSNMVIVEDKENIPVDAIPCMHCKPHQGVPVISVDVGGAQ